MTEPLPKNKLTRRRRNRVYHSTMMIDRYNAEHPGLRRFVESLLRRRVDQHEVSRRVMKRFRLKLSHSAISRFWRRDVHPAEEAEATAYRQAHAQARALIEEMKADPSLDAAKIAEIMLASQIVRGRSKLAEADIMDLYREQRERKKLELQKRALRLREKRVIQTVRRAKKPESSEQLDPEVVRKIREIYGLTPHPPPATGPAA